MYKRVNIEGRVNVGIRSGVQVRGAAVIWHTGEGKVIQQSGTEI